MGILTGMFTAVAGLNAYGNAMSVIGNNIANLGTIGFKSSRATFAELVSASLAGGSGADQIGLGVFLNDIQANFMQGSITTTGNTFDLATNGSLVLNKVTGNYWDKYEGYDMNMDRIGDVPYHPVSMYSMVVEQMPAAVLLWRSFLVLLLDRAERAIPALTPENLKDDAPLMKPYDLHQRS